MQTVLVVGAGATLEECYRSGNFKDDNEWAFPTMTNFARKFFLPLPLPRMETRENKVGLFDSYNPPALNIVLQQYLTKHKITFDDRYLTKQEFLPIEMENSSVNIFIKLERESPEKHNVERLFQFAWKKYGKNDRFWSCFVDQSVFRKLSFFHLQQFGMGLGVEMKAGRQVAGLLSAGDRVVNLNYDICFDLALAQIGTEFDYSPAQHPGGITVFKPHGSMNLFTNSASGNFYFVPPDQLTSSGDVQRDGVIYSALGGILPPILEKNYKAHAIASYIFDAGKPFKADRFILWGVGLTHSDIDLLQIYRDLANSANETVFINPSVKDFERAKNLLNCQLRHVPKLDELF
jgi:hypothetical protein